MGEAIHVKKFMDGQKTPQEVHRELAFGGHRCDNGGCAQPAAIRIRVFGEAKTVMERSPEFMVQLAAKSGGQVPVVDFTYGKFIRVSEVFACERCRAQAEREAAKAPSWCVVEIDTGPKEVTQVQV